MPLLGNCSPRARSRSAIVPVPGAKSRRSALADAVDLLSGKAAPAHPDQISPAQPCALTHHHRIGKHVMLHPGHAADDGVRADPHVLVNGRQAAQDDEIADANVPAEGRIVRHDDMVARCGQS